MTQQNVYTLSNVSITQVTPYGAHSGFDITIQNVNNSGHIYIGNENVSSTEYGYRLLPNHAFSIELPTRDHLYLIAETDGMKAAVLRTGLESAD